MKSDHIFPGWDRVTSKAKRVPQQCISTTTILTQPPNRPRPVGYKIRLRTLSSISNDTWWERSYADYCLPYYEDEPGEDRFKRLAVAHNDAALLDEHPLVDGKGGEWVQTPRDKPILLKGHVSMNAHTFDWWVPVTPPYRIDKAFAKTAAALRGVGRMNKPWPGIDAMHDLSDHLDSPFNVLADWGKEVDPHGLPIFWEQGQDWHGQHREPREEVVRFEYTLTWDDDLLRLTIKNDPAHRNYVIYAVVEEQMMASQTVLHTAVPLAVNGSLTYVPQPFFDEEAALQAEVVEMLTRFNEKYRIERQPGPLDPIISWFRPGHLASREAIQRFIQLAEEHDKALLGRVAESVRNAPRGPIQ